MPGQWVFFQKETSLNFSGLDRLDHDADSGGIKTALGKCSGKSCNPSVQREELGGGWCQVGWEGGETAHAQLSSAHTHTNLRQEDGSSLNLMALGINFLDSRH